MVPDDDVPEPFEDEPTHLDDRAYRTSEHATRAYKSVEFLAGRESGLKEGIDVTMKALRGELVRAGCTEDEIRHIEARVRAGASAAR